MRLTGEKYRGHPDDRVQSAEVVDEQVRLHDIRHEWQRVASRHLGNPLQRSRRSPGLTEAVIFVVDAADEMRYKIASYEFDQAINHQDVRYRKIPILVFLNKVDVKVRERVT